MGDGDEPAATEGVPGTATSPARRRRRTAEEIERERAEKEVRQREREERHRRSLAEKQARQAAAAAAKAERARRKEAEEREKEEKRRAQEAAKEERARRKEAEEREREERRRAQEAARSARARRKEAEEREREQRRAEREAERAERRRRREEEDAERRRRAAPPPCARIDHMFAVEAGAGGPSGGVGAHTGGGRLAHVFSEYQAPAGGACFRPAVPAAFDTDAWLRSVDGARAREPGGATLAAFVRAAREAREAQQAQCRAQLQLPAEGDGEMTDEEDEEEQRAEERAQLLAVLAGAGCAKLLRFAENGRPPWRGRWPGGASGVVVPQDPLARDPHVDYDYDSGIEWNEESGDEIGSDDDDEDEREEEEEEEEAEEAAEAEAGERDDFVVPDGDGDEDDDGAPARKRARTEDGAGAIAVCGVCFDDAAVPDALQQFPVCRLYVDFAPGAPEPAPAPAPEPAAAAPSSAPASQTEETGDTSRDAPFPEELVPALVAFLRSHTGPLVEVATRFADERHADVAMPVLKAKIREVASYNSHTKAWKVHEQYLPRTQPTIQDLFASGPPPQQPQPQPKTA